MGCRDRLTDLPRTGYALNASLSLAWVGWALGEMRWPKELATLFCCVYLRYSCKGGKWDHMLVICHYCCPQSSETRQAPGRGGPAGGLDPRSSVGLPEQCSTQLHHSSCWSLADSHMWQNTRAGWDLLQSPWRTGRVLDALSITVHLTTRMDTYRLTPKA